MKKSFCKYWFYVTSFWPFPLTQHLSLPPKAELTDTKLWTQSRWPHAVITQPSPPSALTSHVVAAQSPYALSLRLRVWQPSTKLTLHSNFDEHDSPSPSRPHTVADIHPHAVPAQPPSHCPCPSLPALRPSKTEQRLTFVVSKNPSSWYQSFIVLLFFDMVVLWWINLVCECFENYAWVLFLCFGWVF